MVEHGYESYEEQIPVSKFAAELKKRNFDDEFSLLDQATYQKPHKARFNKDPEVQHLNRYTDILPCKDLIKMLYATLVEDTRVILKSREGLKKVDTYVNANYVHVR